LITANRLEELELGISPLPTSTTKQSMSSDEPYAPKPFGNELEDDLEEDLDFLNEIESVELGGEEDLFDDESAAEATSSATQNSEGSLQTTEDTKAKKEYTNLLQKLYRSGLLTRYRGGAYQFRHPMIAAYFASLALKDMSTEQRLDKAFDLNWQEAVGFASIHTSIDSIVDARLESPPDMLQNYLLETTRWLAYASKGVEWRATILRQLGNLFVAPNQYPVSRERIAAALLSARDKGATRVFEAGLRHPNPDVRRLSCLGVGALQAENAVGNLSQLLNDPVPDVKLSAALALGAIGDDDALEEMIVALTQGEENVRQAVAEAFAAIPEEGYPVLYDAINHQDMMLRRAAVFGLRRINTPWALISLYRTSLEDDQWYVRSAAEGAFADMQYGDTAHGPRRYPSPESIPWLREWLEKLGDGATLNVQNPEQLLQKALEEGDADVQMLAALNMGQLGIINDMGLLYTALRHHNGQVRSAAYQALSELQLKMGQPLPSPI
jgi:HEAT repeat protein